MKKTIRLTMLAMAFMFIATLMYPTIAKADDELDLYCPVCYSDVIYPEWEIQEVDNKVHEFDIVWECLECGYTWPQEIQEAHEWKKKGKSKTTYSTSSQHKTTTTYECETCGATKTSTKKQDHTDKGYCSKCTFPTSSKTMEDGKYVYRSGRPWLKIEVPKDGYIKTDMRYDNDYLVEISLYNENKELYDGFEGMSFGRYIPVRKGTYYLRAKFKGSNYSVKYTFTAVKNKKNTSIDSAADLEENKYVYGTMYLDQSKNTWTRYHKIKLDEKAKIRIATSEMYSETKVTLCDKSGKAIACSKKNYDYDLLSKNTLSKGTYYIKVQYEGDSKGYTTGAIYKLKWKKQ